MTNQFQKVWIISVFDWLKYCLFDKRESVSEFEERFRFFGFVTKIVC